MKAITSLLVLLLAALSGLAQEAAPKSRFKDQAPDYYPLKVGTKWHYQVGRGGGQKVTVVYQIAKVEKIDGKSLAVLEESVNGEVQATEHIGVENGGVYRYRLSVGSGQKATSNKLSPPVCLLKFPVKEGSSWTTETKLGDKEFLVIGHEGPIEEVQVPAGKYAAVTVKMETTVKESKITNTYWFAPDVGIVKQSAEIAPGKSFIMELSKFEEGK